MCQMSPDMLSLMGAAVVDSLPNTAAIKRAAITQSTLKTPTKTYAIATGAVACRIESIDMSGGNEQLRIIAAKYIGKALYRMIFPVDTDIRLDDRVVEAVTGRIFTVVTDANSISYSVSKSVIGVEFTGA